VVSAPSGTGKSTVLERLLTTVARIRFSVSHTTREPRPGERDGESYHFVDEAHFRDMVSRDRFLEWAEVHLNLYGTSLDEYERADRDGVDLLADLDVQGARQVRERFPGALTVFILPPSYAALEERLRGRGADPEPAIARDPAAAGPSPGRGPALLRVRPRPGQRRRRRVHGEPAGHRSGLAEPGGPRRVPRS